MDEQILARLEKIESQTKENYEILKKLHKFQKRKIIFTFIYWGIIILIALGALVYVRPLLEGVLGAYTGTLEEVIPKNDVQNLKELQKILQQ